MQKQIINSVVCVILTELGFIVEYSRAMKNLMALLCILSIVACSKKTVPARPADPNVTVVRKSNTVTVPAKNSTTIDTVSVKKEDTVAAKTTVVKTAPILTPIPKVITVNEKAAKKTIDGRYYYDLEGHRYWRNNKNGKFYLYNKSMHDDPAFKKP